jgi:hypothetical protein
MTLRGLLDERRAAGQRLRLDEAIAILVPVCLDLRERHGRGERVFVHPSCIGPGADGLARVSSRLSAAPTNAWDRACLAPEQQSTLSPGDARASVFAIGAMLYEMVTGAHVGPAMRRPREIDPQLPDALEAVLSKALVADPTHRPDDLAALAAALYPLAPEQSIHPPPVAAGQLDASAEFEVDVRLSLLPPVDAHNPVIPPSANVPQLALDPFAAVDAAPITQARPRHDPTTKLAELKARLESDPRPRYVVHKDLMDHGPFSAVELLQQIASNAFVGTDTLRDELSGQSHPITEWEEFAPFAEQAALKRQIVAEKHEVARVEQEEKKAGLAKYILGSAILATVGIVAGGWYLHERGERKDDIVVSDDPSLGGIDVSGGIKGQKRATPGRAGGGGGGGGGPSGLSYEAALASNNQEVTIGAAAGGPDLTDAQLHGPMRNAAFISGCGAPDSMKVTVKVAIKNGRAVGVSVYSNPPNPGVSSCVERHVRGLSWPPHPKMDSFVTTY